MQYLQFRIQVSKVYCEINYKTKIYADILCGLAHIKTRFIERVNILGLTL